MAMVGTRFLENLLASKDEVPEKGTHGPVWTKDDVEGIRHYVAFSSSVPFLEPDQSVDGGILAGLHRCVGELNASLPFSEGERLWLLPEIKALPHEHELLARLIGLGRVPVLSAGMRQDVDGRVLVERWADWRREEGEFAGEGSREHAQLMLGKVIRELMPTAIVAPYGYDRTPNAIDFLMDHR